MSAALIVAALTLFSSRLAAADVIYSTIEAIEALGTSAIQVTGIVAGDTTPSVRLYGMAGSGDTATRCDRLALLAMSKPGKFQFVIVGSDDFWATCKLVLRTP